MILQIQLSFLYVGHTYEDIDQFFSVIAEKLTHQEAQTYKDLVNIYPRCSETQGLFDICGWLEDYPLNIIQKQQTLNLGKIRKNLQKWIYFIKRIPIKIGNTFKVACLGHITTRLKDQQQCQV